MEGLVPFAKNVIVNRNGDYFDRVARLKEDLS